MAKSRRILHIPNLPSYRALIEAKDALFITLFSICYQRGCKMGKIEKPLSAIRVWKWYLATAMDCDSDRLLFQKFLAKSWPICQCAGRPALRPLIAGGDSLFLITFPSCVQVG